MRKKQGETPTGVGIEQVRIERVRIELGDQASVSHLVASGLNPTAMG